MDTEQLWVYGLDSRPKLEVEANQQINARKPTTSNSSLKTLVTKSCHRASTLTDVLVVIVTFVVLAAHFLPMLARQRRTGCRINCISNLKQVGLGFRMWSNDHEDKFPWQIPTNQGGSLEYALSQEVFQHFLVASNELSTPKILVCPADKARIRWSAFDPQFGNRNLSYFIGLDADETQPQTLLAGDRTITTNGRMMSGLLTLTTNSLVRWAKGLHPEGGNIALGDGSVQQATDAVLKRLVNAATNLPMRLAIP